MVDREKRKEELRKAIAIVGWVEIEERVKTKLDKQLVKELGKEFDTEIKAMRDARLKEAGITF